ncbi:hypothetical protein V1511DRAFT_123282 [Dipodascopsis uninucleata]
MSYAVEANNDITSTIQPKQKLCWLQDESQGNVQGSHILLSYLVLCTIPAFYLKHEENTILHALVYYKIVLVVLAIILYRLARYFQIIYFTRINWQFRYILILGLYQQIHHIGLLFLNEMLHLAATKHNVSPNFSTPNNSYL